MTAPAVRSRRWFLQAGLSSTGALLLGVSLDLSPRAGRAAAAARATAAPFVPNAFVRIAPDDTITLVVNHSEMGQGVYTSLPMLIAEELECDLDRVALEFAPIDPVYANPLLGAQSTGGSTSTRGEFEPLRRAGAAAREMLVAAAAARWGVEPAACRAESGQVRGPAGGTARYGELAAEAAAQPLPASPVPKPRGKWRLLGRNTHRLDSHAKVTGHAVFGLDLRIPAMRYAAVAHSPVFGGKLRSFDATRAKAVPGVEQVVQVPSGVAVVATDTWAAFEGRAALATEWNEGAGATLSTDRLEQEFRELSKGPGGVARDVGDVDAALARATKRVEGVYSVPYLAHAPMEPLSCTVDLREDGCDVWMGTQSQTAEHAAAAQTCGLPPAQVRLHTTFLGGGFGRRASHACEVVRETVEIAKRVRVPVKNVWSREDDIRGGWYRPMFVHAIEAGIDGNGNAIAWKHTAVGQSIGELTPWGDEVRKKPYDESSLQGAFDMPYAIPSARFVNVSPRNEVPVLWWRSVGHSHTAFAVESMIDELAHAADRDPLAFRHALIGGDDAVRRHGVLDLAASKSGWGKPLPAGRALGLATHKSFESFVACVAEVSVGARAPDGTRKLAIHRMTMAVDCGTVINPDGVAAQMESAVAFALTAALDGKITIARGRVVESNFDDYPLVTLDCMPTVETHLVKSSAPPSGVGEPGVPPVAPAIANAIFAATGTRARTLPLSLAGFRVR